MPISARRDSVSYRTGKFLRRNRTAVVASALAVIGTGLFSAGLVYMRSDEEPSLLQSGALAERDRIVVSHFTDQLGDTMLAAAVTEAFRIDLTQSPHVRVMTPSQVRAALERMTHGGAYIDNDSVAREVAVREGAKAFVSGSITRVGGNYTISVQLLSAGTGEALTAVRENAADSTRLIAAISEASRTLRQRLGESLRDLRAMPALEKVTTASLPALRKFTEGYRLFQRSDRSGALARYQEAVALDTAFATAHSAMANLYSAMSEPGRSAAAKQRALAHLDRLSFRERGIELASAAYGRNDYQTAIKEYNRLLQYYPNDVAALSNLALANRDARNFAIAESLWHRALALDSSINVLNYGLHSALVPQGKLKQARHMLAIIRRRSPDDQLLLMATIQQAAAEQAWAEAERLAVQRVARLQAGTFQSVDAYEQLAGIVMTQGRLNEAERHWRAQLEVSTTSGSFSRRLFGALQLGWLELRLRNRPSEARAIVDSVLALQPLDSLLPADRRYDELARFHAGLGDLPRARALLAAAESNDRALRRNRRAESAWTRGVIELAERKTRTAETLLREAADHHWCTICVLPDLGRAYEAAGKREQALATYRLYITSPWLWRYENDAVELGWVMRRLAELYEWRGQKDQAARMYADLTRLWRAADGPVAGQAKEIRTRLDRLQETSR